ncbi:hypothetical protein ABKV19_019013 [Rosa sericea]
MACRKLRRQKKRKRERFSSLLPTSTASVCLTCTERRRRGIWVIDQSLLIKSSRSAINSSLFKHWLKNTESKNGIIHGGSSSNSGVTKGMKIQFHVQ